MPKLGDELYLTKQDRLGLYVTVGRVERGACMYNMAPILGGTSTASLSSTKIKLDSRNGNLAFR